MNGETLYIVGANAGLGEAIAGEAMRAGYRVALLGRTSAMSSIRHRLGDVATASCDVTDWSSVQSAFTELEGALGSATAVVYNAHVVARAPILDLDATEYERLWRVNSLGAFHVAKRCAPGMVSRGRGTIVFSGATASVRAGKMFGAFASSKFAQRALAQSLAREIGVHGVHVAHVLIDGLVWSERTVERFGVEEKECIAPADLARAYVWLLQQPRSCWTHELDVRPNGANLGTV